MATMQGVRFLTLATGSKGNCHVLMTPHAQVLVDCGLGPRLLAKALQSHSIDLKLIDAVFVTHTHTDHVSGLGPLVNRVPVRVYCHEKLAAETNRAIHQGRLSNSGSTPRLFPAGTSSGYELVPFSTRGGFSHRDLDVLPVPVSHDCSPTIAYKFYVNGFQLGVLTDLGATDSKLTEVFGDCDVLLGEANQCPQMLAQGPYPEFLKARLRSSRGHLSNEQAATFITGLKRLPPNLLLGHVSDVNNRPEVVSAAFERIETGLIPHTVIPQRTVGPMVELSR